MAHVKFYFGNAEDYNKAKEWFDAKGGSAYYCDITDDKAQCLTFNEELAPAELSEDVSKELDDMGITDWSFAPIKKKQPQETAKPAWVLLQYIGENTNTSVIGVYDNLQDLEQGIRSELEHFWMYLVDLKNADSDLTVAQLKEQAISEGVDFLMNRRITLTGRNFHWYVREVKLNENCE